MSPTIWAAEGPGDRATSSPPPAGPPSTPAVTPSAPSVTQSAPSAGPSTPPREGNAAALDGVVRTIGDHARTVNLTRAAGLERALDDAALGVLVDNRRHAAAELAHQLVGSAGTFGFAGVSDLAAELERFLAGGVYDPEQLETARAHLGAIVNQLHDDPDY